MALFFRINVYKTPANEEQTREASALENKNTDGIIIATGLLSSLTMRKRRKKANMEVHSILLRRVKALSKGSAPLFC